MKLDSTQIARLFEFTKQHYVDHYDVQVEIVDHLAAAIEERISQNPALNFENVLDEVFKGFGIFGFDTFVNGKTKLVEREGAKVFWNAFFQYFTWPKLLIFMIFYTCSYALGYFFGLEVSKITVFGVFAVLIVYMLIKDKQTKRKMLLPLSQIEQGNILLILGGGIFSFLNLLLNGEFFISMLNWNIHSISVLTAILVIMYLAQIEARNRIAEKLKDKYPEAFLQSVSDN
jgi:hypothetical protein